MSNPIETDSLNEQNISTTVEEVESKEVSLASLPCPNCNVPLLGPYCANCGQQQIETKSLLITFFNEAFDDIFSFSSRAWKTTFALFFKPGFLSTEYSAGRRKRYIQPLRLYLICSIVFFLVFSIANFFKQGGDLVIDVEPPEAIVAIDSPDITQASESTANVTTPSIEKPTIRLPTTGVNARERLKDRIESEDDWLQANLGEGNLPLLDETQTEKVKSVLERQLAKAKKIAREDPRELLAEVIDIAPAVAFVLLPIFAFVMMLFYPFKRRYYAEHLVLAVHNHCFVFACLTLNLLLPLVSFDPISSAFDAVLFIWMPLYMYISLLRVHQQGKLVTGAKFIALFSIYFTLLGVGALIAMLVGLFAL